MDTRVTAYHVYQMPGPRPSGWQCDAADGNDVTLVEVYGKTPLQAVKNGMKAMKKKGKSR